MSRILTGVAVVTAFIAVGAAGFLYIELRAKDRPVVQEEHQNAPAVAETIEPAPEQAEQDADALRVIRESRDAFLTGDPHGRATWNAPDREDYPTLCGVTPEGRFMIARNEIGSTRFDEPTPPSVDLEPFLRRWGRAGCDKTSPINQSAVIAGRYREDIYKRDHPANSDCLMAQMHAAATDHYEKQSDDPHYCRNGHYERDQAAQTGSVKP